MVGSRYGGKVNIKLGIAFAALSLIVGCGKSSPKSAPPILPSVSVAQPIPTKVNEWDEYTGRLASPETVEVRARVFGYLKTIEFTDGDFVTEGQPLFTIEPDEYQAIHNQSLARIELNTAAMELAKAKHARIAIDLISGIDILQEIAV